MTKQVYRSAQGKSVDLGALIIKNEGERAVGNMSVNARGDIIDNQNHPVSTRAEQVNRNYNRTTNVSSAPVTVAKKTRGAA